MAFLSSSISSRSAKSRPANALGDCAWPLLAILLHSVAVLSVVQAFQAGDNLAYARYVPQWTTVYFKICPVLALCWALFWIVHKTDKWSERKALFQHMIAPERVPHFLSGLVLLAALMVFMGGFTTFKNMMPLVAGGFRYDVVHADIDAFLHFGADPWRWLYAFARQDWIHWIIELNYNAIWFWFCFVPLFWIATHPSAKSFRGRYFTSFVVVWVLVGNVAAFAFLSAGPAFYHLVTGDAARFGEQLVFLRQSADAVHSAARFQDYLWAHHVNGTTGLGTGISAFPSMHVAMVMLNALFVFEHSRRAGIVAFAYVAFTVLSSVYLAWHYAIDGYASILITLAVYVAIRRAYARQPAMDAAVVS